MGFKVFTTVPSSAVATNGTIAFTIVASDWGQVQYEGGHVLFAEGLGAQFSFPAGFTLSYSSPTLTLTYLGTTSIPANSVVKLQLEVPGENNYLTTAFPAVDTTKDFLGNIRCALGREYRVMFGAPAAASATAAVNAVAVSNSALVPLTTVYQPDVPRGLTYKSSNAGDTQTITARGLDEYGQAMTEVITLNGTSAVNGKKAFKQLNSYQASASLAGNLSIGTQAGVFGLPFFIPGGTSKGRGYIMSEIMDGDNLLYAGITAGTIVGGDLTTVSGTTGDVRGTYTPNTAPNAVHVYELVVMASDLTFKGNTQYSA